MTKKISKKRRKEQHLPVCRLPQSVGSSERTDKKQELSANTVAFISFRSRLFLQLVKATTLAKTSCFLFLSELTTLSVSQCWLKAPVFLSVLSGFSTSSNSLQTRVWYVSLLSPLFNLFFVTKKLNVHSLSYKFTSNIMNHVFL